MIFGAFQARYHRYLSEDLLKHLLTIAETSAYHHDVLINHLKNGLFTYRIRPDTNKYLGIVEFRHFDILKRLFREQWSLASIGPVIHHNMATLNNTVLHQPYEEFAGLLKVDGAPLTIQKLRAHTDHLVAWMDHLRSTYKNRQFHSHARKTTVAISLDLLRLIQARQENQALQQNTDPFARASVTDQGSLVEALHHTLISLSQEGIILSQLPKNPDYNRLLERPNLTAACAPGAYVRPIPSLAVFEDLMVQSGQDLPREILISPDADTLIGALAAPTYNHDWGIFDNVSDSVQAIVVASPIERYRYSVYVASLTHDLLTYVGDLIPEERATWGDVFTAMVDHGAKTVTEAASKIPMV